MSAGIVSAILRDIYAAAARDGGQMPESVYVTEQEENEVRDYFISRDPRDQGGRGGFTGPILIAGVPLVRVV